MALINRTYGESEDNRAFITGDYTNIIMQSPLTKAITGITQGGVITDSYTFSSVDYTQFTYAGAATGTLTYDLGEKRKIKNALASLESGNGNGTFKIQGTNDLSGWTDLATASTTANAKVDLTTGEVNYRYIRFLFYKDGVSVVTFYTNAIFI